MELNIKTKYNVGDVVYTAYCYHDYLPLSTPCIVKNILIHGDINRIYFTYQIENDLFVDKVPEDWLFPTYAECWDWCREHNKI